MLPREFYELHGPALVQEYIAPALPGLVIPANPDRYLLAFFGQSATPITVFPDYSGASGAVGFQVSNTLSFQATFALHGGLPMVQWRAVGGGLNPPLIVVQGIANGGSNLRRVMEGTDAALKELLRLSGRDKQSGSASQSEPGGDHPLKPRNGTLLDSVRRAGYPRYRLDDAALDGAGDTQRRYPGIGPRR